MAGVRNRKGDQGAVAAVPTRQAPADRQDARDVGHFARGGRGEGPAYKIFLSYRRSDSGGYAGWLHQLLVDHFAEGQVFRDVDSLRGGERWIDRLDETLDRCDVVLAVIGPGWLTVSNEKGRRLDDPDDRVRLELEAGVRRGVPLIPALVGGAMMPQKDELPEMLQPLCDWQAVRLSDESWKTDLENLIAAIERALQAAPGELQLGTTFAGHEIQALIGRGGMGIVYRGRHRGLDRVDAIKVIAPHLAREAGFRKRFVGESRIAAALRHENVLTVYDAGEQDGLLYLSMQLVEGDDLATLLKESGPATPARAAEILAPVADALQAAHENGLVHRDVKPGNILIESDGGREHIYLGDFGLARETTSATGLTSSGHWIGTADYVSPEQVMGEAVDARADVYALGCVLFEVLSGRVPYPGRSETAKLVAHATKDPPSVAELRPDIPDALVSVVHKAMARAPDQRYPSARSMREALLDAVARDGARVTSRRRQEAAELGPVAPAIPADAATTPRAGPIQERTERVELDATMPEEVSERPAVAPPADGKHAAESGHHEAAAPAPQRTARPREPGPRRAGVNAERSGGGSVAASAAHLEPAASTVRSRGAAGPSAMTAALPAWVRRHPAVALGAAIVLVAGAAFAVGHSGGRGSGPTAAGRQVKAGPVLLTIPSSWRSATPPGVPGLVFANEVAMEESPSGGVLLAGLIPSAGGDHLLPATFSSRLRHAPDLNDPVRVGDAAAYRYRNLAVTDLGRPLTILVAPTNAGVVGVGCLAPATAGGAFTASCERVAGTLHLDNAHALPLGPDPAYGRLLASAVAGLESAQSTARALATARTRADQALLCDKLAQSHAAAAQELAAAKPGPDAAGVNTRFVAALRAAAAGYRDMSRAAHADQAGAYAAARSTTTSELNLVNSQVVVLGEMGYGT